MSDANPAWLRAANIVGMIVQTLLLIGAVLFLCLAIKKLHEPDHRPKRMTGAECAMRSFLCVPHAP